MAFPTSPTNGQQANINGITYTYSSAATAWTVSTSVSNTFVSINVSANVNSGNVLATGVISATGNVSGGNLVVTGNIVDTGALTIVTGSNGNITLSPNGTGIVAATGAISTTGNISANNATFTSNQTLSYGTANGVAYLDGSKVLTTGSALVFDGTNLGVGASTPAAKLEVSTAGGTKFRITSTIDNNCDIDFYTNSVQRGIIEFNSANGLIFTVPSIPLLFGTGNATKMTLAAGGNLTLGDAAAATNRVFNINGVVNKAQRIVFQESSVDKWLIGNGAASENGNFEIYDNTNGKNYVFTRTGVFALPGASASATGTGITFPATQSASTDANTLDDYEEGTWTPTFKGTSSDPTVTYTKQVGRYVKIGRMFYWGVAMVVNTTSGGSGILYIDAPVPILSTGSNTWGGTVTWNGTGTFTGQNPTNLACINGSTAMYLHTNSTTMASSDVTVSQLANGSNIEAFGMFETG